MKARTHTHAQNTSYIRKEKKEISQGNQYSLSVIITEFFFLYVVISLFCPPFCRCLFRPFVGLLLTSCPIRFSIDAPCLRFINPFHPLDSPADFSVHRIPNPPFMLLIISAHASRPVFFSSSFIIHPFLALHRIQSILCIKQRKKKKELEKQANKPKET